MLQFDLELCALVKLHRSPGKLKPQGGHFDK